MSNLSKGDIDGKQNDLVEQKTLVNEMKAKKEELEASIEALRVEVWLEIIFNNFKFLKCLVCFEVTIIKIFLMFANIKTESG